MKVNFKPQTLNMKVMNKYIKTLPLIILVMIAFSCSKKLDQNNMFKGRITKNKKQGHYDTGVRRNKPMSVQYAEEARKENKDADNPKKMAKKAEKELKKKQEDSQKIRAKHNKKVRVKVKTTKGKATGGGN